MIQKIYFGNKPLILCTTVTPEIETIRSRKSTIFINELTTIKIKKGIKQIEQPEIAAVVICYPEYNELFKLVAKEFTLIKAAGGFVYTPANEVLLIFRRKKWDLPKGKLDEGEDLETCAVREVQEETGLINVEIVKPLIITYHTYYEENQPILKESHWYLMLKKERQALVPQAEEDIEKCEWVKFEDVAAYLNNSLASIKDVLDAGIKEIHR